jgi:lipopolysaccharide/colanic/teichoic acid biosynthesis glycosyltransferase
MPNPARALNGSWPRSEGLNAAHRFLDQDLFMTMIRLERKRTERSHRRFILMLLESERLLRSDDGTNSFQKILYALSGSTRETDVKGWYKDRTVLGVIFTEIGGAEGKAVTNALLNKVTSALGMTLSIEQINEVKISFHIFPEQSSDHGEGGPTDSPLYPDLAHPADPKRSSRLVKRGMDVAGSLFALVLFSPLFLVIAAAIKLTSKGPIVYRQERVGRYGRRFTFLKFRSMYFKNDHGVHQEYVKRLIAGKVDSLDGSSEGGSVYKLTNDPRVTPVGKFLRKSSLDELPQLLNVLKGDMSLVGPRPPVPYEFECYQTWHKQRLIAVQPGITGLWQVAGRSRTKFDEMVRLDLKYASSWSPWVDLKILLQTPRAVISGDGAY